MRVHFCLKHGATLDFRNSLRTTRCRLSGPPTSCRTSAACSPKIANKKKKLCQPPLHTRAPQPVLLAMSDTRPYNARQRAQHRQATMLCLYEILEACFLPHPLLRLIDATLPNIAATCRPYRMLAAFLVDDSLTTLHTPCVIPRPPWPLCICIACLMLPMLFFPFLLYSTRIAPTWRSRWVDD